jgi:cellulose synthase/poly-beta-1,6-N-acetylglucosamine synthase-like glycosyltransferase
MNEELNILSVSVVVVVLNAVEHIQECLDSLLAQDYPRERHEILVIDNDSSDGTLQIIERVCRQHPRVRMIVNPIRGIAGSRQLALQLAINPLIAFIDSDCVAPPYWLSSLMSGFEKYSRTMPYLAAVGGSNVPPQEGRFYETLALFLNTYLGSHGSVQGKQFRDDQPVPHLPTVNVLYDKAAVLQSGGFDVTFGNIGEDQDLSFRLQQNGFHLVYLAGCEVIHRMRPAPWSWLKNMFVYGKGRMWLMRKHPQNIKTVLLAPMILVASLPLLLFNIHSAVFLSPLIYFLCIFAVSLFECLRRRRLRLLMPLFLLYVGTHFAYGFGEWIGLFKNREFHRSILLQNSIREGQVER